MWLTVAPFASAPARKFVPIRRSELASAGSAAVSAVSKSRSARSSIQRDDGKREFSCVIRVAPVWKTASRRRHRRRPRGREDVVYRQGACFGRREGGSAPPCRGTIGEDQSAGLSWDGQRAIRRIVPRRLPLRRLLVRWLKNGTIHG